MKYKNDEEEEEEEEDDYCYYPPTPADSGSASERGDKRWSKKL